MSGMWWSEGPKVLRAEGAKRARVVSGVLGVNLLLHVPMSNDLSVFVRVKDSCHDPLHPTISKGLIDVTPLGARFRLDVDDTKRMAGHGRLDQPPANSGAS